jgi:hypothetical protein
MSLVRRLLSSNFESDLASLVCNPQLHHLARLAVPIYDLFTYFFFPYGQDIGTQAAFWHPGKTFYRLFLSRVVY